MHTLPTVNQAVQASSKKWHFVSLYRRAMGIDPVLPFVGGQDE